MKRNTLVLICSLCVAILLGCRGNGVVARSVTSATGTSHDVEQNLIHLANHCPRNVFKLLALASLPPPLLYVVKVADPSWRERLEVVSERERVLTLELVDKYARVEVGIYRLEQGDNESDEFAVAVDCPFSGGPAPSNSSGGGNTGGFESTSSGGNTSTGGSNSSTTGTTTTGGTDPIITTSGGNTAGGTDTTNTGGTDSTGSSSAGGTPITSLPNVEGLTAEASCDNSNGSKYVNLAWAPYAAGYSGSFFVERWDAAQSQWVVVTALPRDTLAYRTNYEWGKRHRLRFKSNEHWNSDHTDFLISAAQEFTTPSFPLPQLTLNSAKVISSTATSKKVELKYTAVGCPDRVQALACQNGTCRGIGNTENLYWIYVWISTGSGPTNFRVRGLFDQNGTTVFGTNSNAIGLTL